MKLVITMSRRFGTGASIIASELSERLGVPVYDKAYIEEKINDHEYESEAEAIRKLAEKPCIILGRCASISVGQDKHFLVPTVMFFNDELKEWSVGEEAINRSQRESGKD